MFRLARVLPTLSVLAVIAVTIVAPAASAAPVRPPKPGAIKVPPALMYTHVRPAVCGLTGTTFEPGSRLARGWFLTHRQQAATATAAARKAKGAAARKLRAQAAAAMRLRAKQLPMCEVPRGAMRSRPALHSKATGYVCHTGLRAPGRAYLGETWFATHAVQMREFLRLRALTTGAAKRFMNTRYLQFKARHDQQSPACRTATTTDPTQTNPNPNPNPTPLRFNLAGAAGLAVKPSSSGLFKLRRGTVLNNTTSSGSNLAVVADDGSTRDAATSGGASVSKVLVAPNGATYLLFQTPVNLDDTSTTTIGASRCLLASVDTVTGVPTCIDDQLMSINWWGSGFGATNPPIQFDASGAIYYSGTKSDGRGVLRRSSAGVRGDLVNDFVSVSDFLVYPDGTVYLSGRTNTTNSQWFRRLDSTNLLAEIEGSQTNFIRTFPDGNIYVGLYRIGEIGVFQYDPVNRLLNSNAWISNGASATNPASAECQAPYGNDGFCMASGTYVRHLHVTATKAFAIAGTGNEGSLMRYYPTLDRMSSILTNTTLGVSAGEKLFLAGKDSVGNYRMTVFDAATEVETPLTPPAQIEAYHFDYVPSDDVVLFDGLRFSDNTYVFGSIDVATGAVTVRSALGERWNDFEAFG